MYAATRSALIAFSHALRREVAGTGVRVSTVLPGWTRTAMLGNMQERALRASGVLTPWTTVDDPARPARAIVDAARRGRLQVLLGGLPFSMADLLGRLSPRALGLYYRWCTDTTRVCEVMQRLGP